MKKFLIGGLALFSLSGAPAQSAELIGDKITCSSVGGGTFGCTPSESTVGAGQEFAVGRVNEPFIGLDFSANGLVIRNTRALDLSLTIIELRNLTNIFSSATLLSSNITNFNASNVSLNQGLLTINFRGTLWDPGSGASIGLTTTQAIPEPTTWAMLILGFLGIGASMRAARRKQNVSVSYT